MTDITELFALGCRVGEKLVATGQTVAVAESSAGGLISAALLARAGASAYYFGGAVLYTRRSRRLLTTLTGDDMAGMRSSSPTLSPFPRFWLLYSRNPLSALDSALWTKCSAIIF